MRLPVVPRAELDAARAERDAWRRRAESSLAAVDVQAPRPPARRPGRRRPSRALLAAAMLATGAALGALTLSARTEASLSPDYPGCIGQARYEAPIQGNPYQELVNALYACGVYELP